MQIVLYFFVLLFNVYLCKIFSQHLFDCPVPKELQNIVKNGESVIDDFATIFVDLIPIRTPPRCVCRFLFWWFILIVLCFDFLKKDTVLQQNFFHPSTKVSTQCPSSFFLRKLILYTFLNWNWKIHFLSYLHNFYIKLKILSMQLKSLVPIISYH